MQELVFLFAEEWGWSVRDLYPLSGGEILDLVRKLNKRRQAEYEAKRKAGPQCPLLMKPKKRK